MLVETFNQKIRKIEGSLEKIMYKFVDSRPKKDNSGEHRKRGIARQAGRMVSGLQCNII